MATPYFIVSDHHLEFKQAVGIVAGIFPDYSTQTAVVCIQDQNTDGYNDYRAVWRDAAGVKRGDFVVFNIMDALDGTDGNDDTNICITSLSKTNDFVYLTGLQKLCL